MLFKKHIPAPAEREPVSAEPEPAQAEENPFLDAANALLMMQEEGALPEGFDLDEACEDPAFAQLLSEFEPNAAVRIYTAENRAEHAYEEAMAVMTEKLNARNALPKATRPNRAIAPTPDYQSLSSEAFRALERQIKAAVRDGKRITL